MACLSTINVTLNLLFKYDARLTKNFKGFNALKTENNDPNNDGDLHEAFNIGHEEIDADSGTGSADNAMSGENVWPEEGEVSGFRERLLKY